MIHWENMRRYRKNVFMNIYLCEIKWNKKKKKKMMNGRKKYIDDLIKIDDHKFKM